MYLHGICLIQVQAEIMSDENAQLDPTSDREYSEFEAKDASERMVRDTGAVFISELLGGEISPPKLTNSPPKILRHVINHTFNTNTSPSKFACCLPILVS